MATTYKLKPYAFNYNDLAFLRKQINFKPLFDELGNAIINWDGTGTVYNSNNLDTRVAYEDLGSVEANIAAYGTSYGSLTDFAGMRDQSGQNNNLYLANANWGAADQPFLQRTQVVFDQYVKPLSGALQVDLANPANYVDGDVNGTLLANPTEMIPVDPNAFYALKFATPPTAGADYEKTATHSVQNVVDYTPRMISQLTTTAGVTFATLPGDTHLIKDANGFTQVNDYGDLQASGLMDAQPAFNEDGTPNTEYFIGATNPGVAPVNGWFVLFGQFFDHGLDFIGKGADGTKITINLAPTDPMYGVIDPNTGMPATKIVISRADVSGFTADGTPQWVNHTSPYIDQSQTYGSSAEVTDILREWVQDPISGQWRAGAHLLDGNTSVSWKNAFGELTNATLPTINELRQHLIDSGRADLTWEDLANLRNRDATGQVEAGLSGQSLLLDSNPRFDAAHFENPLNPDAVSFLDTIQILSDAAALAGATFSYNGQTIELQAPAGTFGPGSPAMTVTGASALALWVDFSSFSIKSTMQSGPDIVAMDSAVHDAVGDMLLASVGDHYVAGDGRANENIGLTAVHHVWHEEHNFQVRNIQEAVAAEDIRQERLDQDSTYEHDLLHDWQLSVATNPADTLATGVSVVGDHYEDAAGNYVYANGDIAWNEDRLFSAAKITVEMEYQHTAIDQFARTITPNIAEFVGYNAGSQADVSLDFAQVAYRFGHSTLRESIDLIDPAGDITGRITRLALEKAFLNPELFANTGAAKIALGMTHQQANEIDEYLTPALNQGLLGLPLDLAAINIARGRDVGIPTLNAFRAAINLDEYVSWADFGANMIHPDNLVNFIAAYSFDGDIGRAAALIGLDDGSILEGSAEARGYTVSQALDFLNNTDASLYGVDGFNHIDTWLGGLAEVHVTGGLLGETFDTVFADQMTRLMNGDRFYYLYRLDQLQMGEGIINEQFKDIVERNTGAEHLNGSVFAYADKYYDLAETAIGSTTVLPNAKTEHKYGEILEQRALDELAPLGIYSTKGNSTAGNGSIVTINGVQFIRDIRVEDSAVTSGTTAINGGANLDGTPNSGAESHEVIVASDNVDLIYAWGGDDTVYAEGGNDTIYGGNGIDRIYGGDGDDRILGGDGGDLLDGGAGDDYVSGQQSATAAAGLDQVIGGEGNDILHSGVGIDKLSGESGDDFIFGEEETDAFTHGGDGNDVIDGGVGGDLLWADDGDDLVIGGDDQDISAGGNGDDILRPGIPSLALGGGPDEVVGGLGKTDFGNDGKGFGFDIIDFSDHPYSPQGVTALFSTQQNPLVQIDVPSAFPAWVGVEGAIGSQSNDTLDANITNVFGGSNWLFGGSGNDTLVGGLGNDVLIGDGIRLDSLIGTYAGGYDNYLDGASHRAAGFVQNNGLLGNAALGTEGFEKHYTNMLSSATFENLVLGGSEVTRLWRNGVTGTDLADSVKVGDGGTVGTADVARFAGNVADYTVTSINFTDAHGNAIKALKVVDGVAGRDGTDILVGVERANFADQLGVVLVNNTPVAVDDAVVATEDLAVTYSAAALLGNDTDADGNPLAIGSVTFGAGGTVVLNGDGTVTFTPDANFNGVASFTYTATDGSVVDAISNTATVTVTVEAVDDAPVGTATAVLTAGTEDTAYTVQASDMLAGFSDVEGDLLSVSGLSASNGTVVANLDGSYTITPSLNFNGAVTLSYNVIDGNGGSVAASQSYSLVAVNDAPTGGVTINNTAPSLNQVLTASNTLADVDGLGAIVYQWEQSADGANWAPIAGAASATFTTTLAQASQQVRVVASYVDAQGTPESVASAATTAVFPFNIITGTNLANTLVGTALPDQIFGLGGNDVLNGGAGNDSLVGGAGNDSYYVDSVGDIVDEVALGSAGIDTVFSSVGHTLSANVENLRFTVTGNVDGTGNGLSNIIFATAGNNVLDGAGGTDTVSYFPGTATGVTVSLAVAGAQNTGGSGTDTLSNFENITGSNFNDALTGNAGANRLEGGTGNDTLDGGAGSDVLVGGAGDDTYVVDAAGDGINESLAAGIDTVLSSVTRTLGANQENLTLTGTGAINGTGNGEANVITGNSGNNQLSGGIGADTLIGGTGVDQLTGGAGNDVFVFNTGDTGVAPNRDLITDWVAGDKIDLRGFDADSTTAGLQSFLFIGDLNAAGPAGNLSAAGQLHFYQFGGNTFIQGETNGVIQSGGTLGDFQIAVAGLHTFTAGDFIL